MGGSKLLTLFAGGLTWLEKNALLYDTFTTAETAPLTSPRTCEPGPGTLTVIDSGNKASISNSALAFSGVATNFDPSVSDGAGLAAKQVGYAVYGSFINNSGASDMQVGYFSLFTNASVLNANKAKVLARFNNDMYAIIDSSTAYAVNDTAPAATYKGMVVLRNVGAFYIVDGELLWADDTAWAANLGLAAGGVADLAQSLDEIAELPLASYNSAWGGDWTEVLVYDASVANGQHNFGYTGDLHFRYEITTSAAPIANFYHRTLRIDDDNRLQVENAADVLRVRQKLGGGYTTFYSSSDLSPSTTYVLDVEIDRTNHKVRMCLDGVEKLAWTSYDSSLSAATHDDWLTATTTVDELYIWPLDKLGIATSRVVCPQTGDAATHTDDFIVEYKNVNLHPSWDRYHYLRYVGAQDYIKVQFSQNGALIVTSYYGGSNSTEISAGAATVSDGDDVVLVFEGVNCEAFVNGISVGSSSTVGHTTGTAFQYTQAVSGIDHIACFPRDLTSLLPTELI